MNEYREKLMLSLSTIFPFSLYAFSIFEKNNKHLDKNRLDRKLNI